MRLLEPPEIGAGEEHPRREVGLDHPRGVAGPQGDHVLAQRAAQVLGDGRHHAEVDEDERELAPHPVGHEVAGAKGASPGAGRGATKRLPGWGSAWTKWWTKICCM